MEQGCRANPDLIRMLGEEQPGVIYDGSMVPQYSLPDPLVHSDGLRIVTSEL
ncbi:MAG: hypothetical protein FGF51_02625 [Candidatus Brockarchaeota archaeon]|nr:hypothetical protein [Candidatus Brockarchaeota archaeon]